MKRLQLIAVLVGLATIAVLSSPAHARLYQMMRGSNVYPAVPAPMPAAGGSGVPHVGVNVYPRVPSPMPHPDGPNLYQYVSSNPVNWVDWTGNGKEKPGGGTAPAPSPAPNPAAQPAGRGSTCGIEIKRSAICKIFGQTKPSDFGHEWLEIPDGAGGTAYADSPSSGRRHPYIAHSCHRYERANPMWIWNAHVRFFGGSLPSGKSCGEATCSEIRECMLQVMDDWAKRKPSGELEIPYNFWNRNCIQFVNTAVSKCCMARGALTTRIPKPFEELKSCCEREKDMDSMPGCNETNRGPS